MAFWRLNLKNASTGYRVKRFAAFAIDAVIVITIIYIVFRLTGRPDFAAVQHAMEVAKAGADGPNSQQLANEMFSMFNSAYYVCILIWFTYEVLTQLIFNGASAGKRLMNLRIIPINPNRNLILHHMLLIVRSAVKGLFLCLFQGFPFLIACLTIFANADGRSGFDMFVKTSVKNVKELVSYENCSQYAAQER